MQRQSNRVKTSLDAFSFDHGAGGIEGWTLRGNRLRVLLAPSHFAPVVSVMVQYAVGSADEQPGMTGYAHLLEHMMFKSIIHPGTGETINPDDVLNPLGAVRNANTGKDCTNYYTLAPDNSLERILELEALRMRNLVISDREMATEVQVVLNELSSRENHPVQSLFQSMHATAFTTHPYGHPVIGSLDDLQRVSAGGLRQFYESYYCPNNAIVMIMGNFEIAVALELVHRHFGHIGPQSLPAWAGQDEPEQVAERRFTLKQSNPQAPAQVMIGYVIPPAAHPDTYALSALDYILSGSSSSRLKKRLVDGGLAAHLSIMNMESRWPGLFIVHAIASQTAALSDVEGAILDEIAALVRDGVSKEELSLFCQSYVKAVALSREDPFVLASMLADAEAVAGWQRFAQYGNELEKLTPGDVQKVAYAYLRESNRTVGQLSCVHDAAALAPHPVQPSCHPNELPPAEKRTGLHTSVIQLPGTNWRGSLLPGLKDLRRQKTRNGIDVLFYPAPGSGSVSLYGKIRAGSVLCPPDRRDVAAMVAGMLERGCAGLNKYELAAMLEEMAVDVTFHARSHQIEFGARVHPGDLSKLVSLLARMLSAPTFVPEEVNRLRQSAMALIAHSTSSTEARAQEALMSLIYPPTSVNFLMPAAARMSMLQEVTVDDLISFYKQFVSPQGLVLSIAGEPRSDVFSLIEDAFSGWWGYGGNLVSYAGEDEAIDPPAAGVRRIDIDMPGKQSATCLLGHASNLKTKSDDHLPALIANAVLGRDAISSRLGKRVRKEKGYSYAVRSGFADPSFGSAPYLVQLNANNACVEQAILEARLVVEQFVEEGIRPDELSRELQYTRGARKVSLRTTSGIASLLAHFAFLDLDLETIANFEERLSDVTVERANDALRRHIRPGEMVAAVAGSISSS